MCLGKRFEELVLENERMRVALKPFADAYSKQYDADCRQANRPYTEGGGKWPERKADDTLPATYGQCQAAYVAINQK